MQQQQPDPRQACGLLAAMLPASQACDESTDAMHRKETRVYILKP